MKRQAADDWDAPEEYDDDDLTDLGELSFEDEDAGTPAEAETMQYEAEQSLTGLADPHEESVGGSRLTDDDLAPETLFNEDGARSPAEQGTNAPADRALREVQANQIGAGDGLDEAELGRVDPLDGKPWQE